MTTQEESENNNIKAVSGIWTVYQGKVGKKRKNWKRNSKDEVKCNSKTD